MDIHPIGKLISSPLSITTWIFPASCLPLTGLSFKVFMPLLKYELAMLRCQVLRVPQLLELQAGGLSELDAVVDIEDRLAVTLCAKTIGFISNGCARVYAP
jgi:hypothetical protein